MSSSVVSSDSHACLAVFNLLLGCNSGCSGAGDGSLITGIGEDAARSVSEWSLYYNNNIGNNQQMITTQTYTTNPGTT